jgi:hypothetical protein
MIARYSYIWEKSFKYNFLYFDKWSWEGEEKTGYKTLLMLQVRNTSPFFSSRARTVPKGCTHCVQTYYQL